MSKLQHQVTSFAMDNKLQTFDYIIIFLMLILSSAVGIYFRFTGGRQKTIDEYLMGDKKMKMFPVSVSLMAAYMSANSILGVPSETYLFGTQYSVWMIGTLIGSIIAIYGFLPVYFDLNINSVNEYLGIRFGSTTRSIVAFLQVLKTIFYTAVVIYSPSLALNAVTGVSIWTAAITMSCACTFYCSLGGIKAVLWTDIFQAILMYTTLIAVIIGGIQTVGFIEILTKSEHGGRFVFFNFNTSLTERYSFWNCIIYGIFLNTSAYAATQTELQRVFSTGNLRKGQQSILLGTILSNIFLFLCIWSGIVLFALYEDCDPILSSQQHLSPDQLIPLVIMKLFSNVPGLAGLCVAGIFSASLSTISSSINSLTSMTVEDFLKPYSDCECFNVSRMACAAKLLTLVYGVFCLLLSFMVANFRGILEANTVMGGMIGGPVTGIFALGIFCKDANQMGSLFGLMAGFVFGLWAGFGTYIVKVKIETLPRSTDGCNSTINEMIFSEGFYRNFTDITTKLSNDTSNLSSNDDKGYVFPLYEIAYLWIPVFACLITLISGTIGSYFINCCTTRRDVHPQTLSPIVRNFYFRTKSETSNNADSKENSTPGMTKERSCKTIPETHIKKT